MPSSARSLRINRRRLFVGIFAATLLAAVFVVGNPLTERASATTIPMVFPLEFRVRVLQDYLAPRAGHLHQGTDLMAPKMTKELAVVSGTVSLRVTSYNGVPSYSLWLAGDDGRGYFYIHINNDTPGTDDGAGGLKNAFAPGLVSGTRVKQGQHIAYVGDSGNAEGTGSHLHFEIHGTTSMSSPSLNPYDSLTNAPLAGGTQPPPPPPPPVTPAPSATRYQQNNTKILYLGKWITFTTSGASGGTYAYAQSPATAQIWFSGTRLDLIATKGLTQGKARVSVDGAAATVVNLYSPTVLRQQRVWSTGTLDPGTHKVTVAWTGQAGASGGIRANIDAVDVTGTLVQAALSTVEQTSGKLVYKGTWTPSSTSSASGGSFSYAKTSGASVTVKFTGTYMSWLAKKSPLYGIAKVTLDNKAPVLVDLYNSSTFFKQRVWNTGVLAAGSHTVVIEWTGKKNAAAKSAYINVDAVQLLGVMN